MVLQEAIGILREVLEVRTRQRVPLEWAATEANIGNTLLTIGRQTSGTTETQEAVVAYRQTLQEVTRENSPATWALIQNNLGDALSVLGSKEHNSDRLSEAIAAFDEALKVRTETRYPVDWAITQYNLGSAFSDLASYESGTTALENAAVAYREALKELTQKSAGLVWARVQTNLGNALFRLGRAKNANDLLQEAATAYRDATKEWTRETSPLDWAMEQNNIGDALFEAAEHESTTTNLSAAVAAYRAAAQIRKLQIARDPVTWAGTQIQLCHALATLRQRSDEGTENDNAIIECNTARQILSIILNDKDKLPSSYVLEASKDMGALSYYLVLMRDYKGALEAASEVLAVSPELEWVNVNKAHALMFLGRTEDARQLYFAQKGTSTDNSWKQPIRADFAELRSFGLDAPLMHEVESEFAKQ